MEGIRSELASLQNEERALVVSKYFQTLPGQYAAGDIFWGISNPLVRQVAKKWENLELTQVENLLQDPVHECRFAALLIWIRQYHKGSTEDREAIFEGYLKNLKYINNWDLVDLSARDIVGRHLFNKERHLLYELAGDQSIWTQRVALIATFYFIRYGQFTDSLRLIEKLLAHPHHLIHKAMGWILREIGKKDLDCMEEFLHLHIRSLPRTTLRYAIERLTPIRRQYYLSL
ncbi:DNA alkylation repair protein [Arundinibacter roseus]|uniref:DNA alkylation repair protein n=1 Tax=Arundinibacter roseus TaxID=2070510 RepID=A0A4R4K8E6_9BACT|nr:DNA alkylation repair protein [Arundinibacter roseus]TDB63683.1 DNA alkylation repair protein [Arundinibacter roseus]